MVVISHLGRSGYNVQRALSALGVRSFLVTDRRAGSLRFARGAKRLHHIPGDMSPADDDAVVEAINAAHRKRQFVSVIPTDVPAAKMLARIRDRLAAESFPSPDSEVLDSLDNKWGFAQVCMALGVTIPTTLFFPDAASIDVAAIEQAMTYPIIVKPSQGFGQHGIEKLNNAAEVARFQQAGTHPFGIVVQKFIPGEDWSISIMAIDGAVTNWTAWECPSQLSADYGRSKYLITKFSGNAQLVEMVRQIVAHTKYSGIANFDARMSDTGEMVLFECNPRVFNRLLAARICGLNFIGAGMPMQFPQRAALDQGAYFPWREAFTGRGLKRLLTGEWPVRYLARDLFEMVCDPLPPVIRNLTGEDTWGN